jgi:predicted exporter
MKARWRIAAWLVFVALCVTVISRTHFTADMSAFLPRSPTPSQKILVDQVRDGVVSRLILIGVEGAPRDVLAQISKGMAAQLRGAQGFVKISNGEGGAQKQDFDFLWRNRYLLSPEVTAERYSAAGLRDSLQNYLDLLASPLGTMAQRVLPGDPGGELIGMLERLQGQAHPNSYDGVWFSSDNQRAMLLAQTQAPGSDLDAQEQAMQAVDAAFSVAARQAGAGAARVQMTGPGVFSVQSRAAIRSDAMHLSVLATVMVSLLLLAVYRSPRALILGLLPVASGALAGIAAVSLGFGSVHGITLGFGVTLIGEGVDYAIYLFAQIAPGSAPRDTLRRIWPTLRLGVLTSICGFSAMLLSGFTGLAQLGLFSIAGLLVAVGTTRWVLPDMLPAGFFVRANPRLGAAVMALLRTAPRLKAVVLPAVAIIALSLVLHRGSLWDDALGSLSPVPKQLQQLDEQLRRGMGAPDIRYMVFVRAADEQAVLERSEAIAARLRTAVRDGVLEDFDAPGRYLPSLRAQRARQAALPDAAALRRNLHQALQGLPFRAGLFAPFLQDVERARHQAPVTEADLRGTDLALKVDALLLKRSSGWVAMLPLREVKDAAALEKALQLANQPDTTLLDLKGEATRMFLDYRHEVAKYALIGVAAILLLLAFSLRSMSRVLDVSLPLAAAVVAAVAWHVWSGHLLTIFHLIGLLLAVAVGSNYALFFDRHEATAEARGRTITSLLLANISTVIGFGLLSFSRAPVLEAIGSTVALGAVFSLLFSAVMIRRESQAPEA